MPEVATLPKRLFGSGYAMLGNVKSNSRFAHRAIKPKLIRMASST
jgi:hypothetical protein